MAVMEITVRGRRWLTFAALLMAWAVVGTPLARAEPVRVQAALHEDFGRIVFNWKSPVSHKSEVRDGRLTVRFGRPIEATFGRVQRSLRKYVSEIKSSNDGKSIVISLNGDFDAYTYDSGNAVIVEIAAKEPGEAEPPAKTAEKTAETAAKPDPGKSQDLPLVRVRTGLHEAYTRIVFDWPRKVSYTFKQDGGTATLTFARAARIDLKSLQSRPPRFIGGARSRTTSDSVTVTLTVSETSKVKHFLSGPKVVLDVGRPSGTDKAAALPPVEDPAKEKNTKQAKQAKAPAGDAPAAPKALKPEPKEPPETAAAEAGGKAPKLPPSAPGPAPTSTPGKAEAQSAVQAAKSAAAETASPPAPGQPTRLMPKPLIPKAPGSAGPGAVPGATGALGLPAVPGQLPPLPPTPSQVTAKAGPPEKAIVSLRFDWDEPVGAAVFRRAGFLWVAFDKPTAIDVGQLRQTGDAIIKGIEQMKTPDATVLRMATDKGINPSLRRDGLAWILDFRKQPIEATTPLAVKAQPNSPVGSRLFVPVAEPGDPIVLTDPEVGDNIVIVPVIPLGHGTEVEYIYPQLRFLPTSQGLVIKPLGDDIRVRSLRQGLEITSGDELYISEVSAEAEANRRLAAMKPLTRILDLERWEIQDVGSILKRRHELFAATIKAKGPKLETARMNLVRFFFANGFFVESLSIMSEVAKSRIEIEQDPEFRMLRGVSHYMLGRFSEAANDFTHRELAINDEAIFWRAAVRAATGDMTGAAKDLRRTAQIFRPYPKSLKIPMGVLVTKSSLEIGDIKQARHFLEILRLDDLTPAEKTQLDLEEGRLKELTGDFDGAVSKWEKVRDGYHRPSRAKAIVARMELLLKLNRITRKEAIEDLEKLRFSWRGDEFEFNMLRRLGKLYLDQGLYREGLDRLRQAATYYRTHPEAPEVTQRMSDAFSGLFLNDGADTLPPVTTIAIYDEFKELTPAGAQGDEMIRKLADRLVGVDLLERAANLLNSQVRFRLEGAEKSRVGTQLALIHVLGKEYPKAIAVLDETNFPNLPEPILTQRRHIRAKSLLGMGQSAQALEILADDQSTDADLLRTELFWKSRNWSKASQALRRLIRGTQAKPGGKLDRKQAAHILNYAVALTLSGNERALSRLRGDFAGSMEKTDLKDAFKMITTPETLGLIDPGDVVAQVKDVENFQSFMAAYRDRLKKQTLSELVPGLSPIEVKKYGAKKPDDKKPDAKAPEGETPDAKATEGETPDAKAPEGDKLAPQTPARATPQAEAPTQSPAAKS